MKTINIQKYLKPIIATFSVVTILVAALFLTSCSGKNNSNAKFTFNFVDKWVLTTDAPTAGTPPKEMCDATTNDCSALYRKISQWQYGDGSSLAHPVKSWQLVDWTAANYGDKNPNTILTMILKNKDNPGQFDSLTVKSDIIKSSPMKLDNLQLMWRSAPTLYTYQPFNWLN